MKVTQCASAGSGDPDAVRNLQTVVAVVKMVGMMLILTAKAKVADCPMSHLHALPKSALQTRVQP